MKMMLLLVPQVMMVALCLLATLAEEVSSAGEFPGSDGVVNGVPGLADSGLIVSYSLSSHSCLAGIALAISSGCFLPLWTPLVGRDFGFAFGACSEAAGKRVLCLSSFFAAAVAMHGDLVAWLALVLALVEIGERFGLLASRAALGFYNGLNHDVNLSHRFALCEGHAGSQLPRGPFSSYVGALAIQGGMP